MYKKGRAWIEIDLGKLETNVAFFRRVLPEGCRMMPAVKADAYGHGAHLIAEKLQKLGISDFCVASAGEGCQLREAGIHGQILVLGYTHPRDFELLETYHLTQTVVDPAYAGELQASGRPVCVHAAVDTGMHRLGMEWEREEEIVKLWRRGLRVTGVYSHLCVADGRSEEEERFTEMQIARFKQITDRLRGAGLREFAAHLQGSYGILNYPGCSFDCARPGIALYGILSRKADRTRIPAGDLMPVLSLKARIGCVRSVRAGEGAGYGLAFVAKRDTRLAVLSAGYADGIPGCLAGRGYVLIRGRRAPVAGRICMDQMLVDVTDIPEAEPAGEAVLIGSSGGERITVEQYAEWTGTIANEIVSRLGDRLPRIAV